MIATLAFYIFSSILLLAASGVIFSRNTVHAVLFLILALFNAAGLFLLLGAEFLAMILIIVYVGAVAVLFLFVIMMMDIRPITVHHEPFQWSVFKQALKELIRYMSVWLTVLGGFFYTACWTGHALSKNEIPYLFYDYIPAAFAPLFSHIHIPPVIITVSTVLLLTSLFLASAVTVTWTRTTIFQILTQLFKGISATWLLASVLLIELGMIFFFGQVCPSPVTLTPDISPVIPHQQNTHALADLIYKDYVFAFLMSGLILLVAMIGAIVLTFEKRCDSKRQNIADQLARRKEDTLKLCNVKTGEGI